MKNIIFLSFLVTNLFSSAMGSQTCKEQLVERMFFPGAQNRAFMAKRNLDYSKSNDAQAAVALVGAASTLYGLLVMATYGSSNIVSTLGVGFLGSGFIALAAAPVFTALAIPDIQKNRVIKMIDDATLYDEQGIVTERFKKFVEAINSSGDSANDLTKGDVAEFIVSTNEDGTLCDARVFTRRNLKKTIQNTLM